MKMFDYGVLLQKEKINSNVTVNGVAVIGWLHHFDIIECNQMLTKGDKSR